MDPIGFYIFIKHCKYSWDKFLNFPIELGLLNKFTCETNNIFYDQNFNRIN